MSRHRTLKDIEEKTGHMVGNERCRATGHRTLLVNIHVERKISLWQPCFWSHDFDFLHKPIMYGVVHLLYGVVTSDNVVYVNLILIHCLLNAY